MKRVKKKPVITANLTLGETTVDNPMFSRDHPESKGNPRKVSAKFNKKESPIVWMYTQRERTGVTALHVETASKFRTYFEAAAGGSFGSSGDIKEFVDGGGFPDILTDRQAWGARRLAAVRGFLDQQTYDVVRDVCGIGLFISQLDSRRRTRDALSKRLKDGLDRLAPFLGVETDNKRKRA